MIVKRSIRALLGFMTRDEAVAFQKEPCIPSVGEDDAAQTARWQPLAQVVQALQPILDFNVEARPLTGAAQTVATRISSDPAFTMAFGTGPHTFQSVRLDRIVSRQWYVDLEHLEELHPPDEADEAAVLDFCMRANPIEPPIRSSDGAITFSSHFAGNLVATNMSFDVVSDNEVKVSASVRSRPNYVYIVQVNDRYIMQNGYHRAVSLLQAGHARIPCFVKPMNPPEMQMLMQQPGFFDIARIMLPRPPLIQDFPNDVACAEFETRARNHIMRVGLQVMPFEAPR